MYKLTIVCTNNNEIVLKSDRVAVLKRFTQDLRDGYDCVITEASGIVKSGNDIEITINHKNVCTTCIERIS